jgi:hypothetical protein
VEGLDLTRLPISKALSRTKGSWLKMADAASWNGNWAWSLPLIVLNVVLHVIGLGFINVKVMQLLTITKEERYFVYMFALVMGVTVLLATVLHGLEAGVWAVAYRMLGAIPDNKSAILYSLSAITTYGHAELYLAQHWQLMGALEALNGVILIGLTTAFMYGIIQRAWPVERRAWHSPWAYWSHHKNAPDGS